MTAALVRQDLLVWMMACRRVVLVAGLAVLFAGRALGWVTVPVEPVGIAIGALLLYNEGLRWLVRREGSARLSRLVNVQVAIDVLCGVAVLHFGGGLTNPALLLMPLPFFVYGAVLPLSHAFGHAAAMIIELAFVALAERSGVLQHYLPGFYLPDTHTRADFLALAIVYVGCVDSLAAYMSCYMSRLLQTEEQQTERLAAERGALLAGNEREAARVQALLDVAQHVSGSHTVDELLRSVCDTTVALVQVPRVEIFLWDAAESCLKLGGAHGLSDKAHLDKNRRYSADVPIVARLRAGEVVDFGTGPAVIPGGVPMTVRRGFAAPMVCRGSFEGALFVGYAEEDSAEVKELVQGIARQAAVALVNVRTMEQQQEDAEVSGVLLGISQGLSACLDEDALWMLLVRGATDILGLPWAVATRFDERGGTFSITGAQGVPEAELQGLASARFRLEDAPRMQEALSTRELVVSDESGEPPFAVPHGWKVGAWISIPLFRAGWVAGFLTAGTRGQDSMSRRQLRLAEGLGHHASIALQNARLVNDLEEADRLKSEFVSTMSHELRTPLNVIIGYTEMLRDGALGPVTPGQRDLIDRLDARGRELLELIEATLHVGRLEAGRDTVELAPIAIADLVKALQASTAGLPRPPGVGFEWETPGTQEPIITDRAKLALVVRNLVSNAFKFTPEGKVVVRMMLREDDLVIEVRDTGIGIGEEHLPLIFEMFRQVDGSMTRRHGGVGLGLYIVKQFVNRLGGTVDVTSTPGRGSRFRVVLPGAVRPDSRQSSAAA